MPQLCFRLQADEEHAPSKLPGLTGPVNNSNIAMKVLSQLCERLQAGAQRALNQLPRFTIYLGGACAQAATCDKT